MLLMMFAGRAMFRECNSQTLFFASDLLLNGFMQLLRSFLG